MPMTIELWVPRERVNPELIVATLDDAGHVNAHPMGGFARLRLFFSGVESFPMRGTELQVVRLVFYKSPDNHFWLLHGESDLQSVRSLVRSCLGLPRPVQQGKDGGGHHAEGHDESDVPP